MSDLGPQVSRNEGGRRHRRLSLWVWPIAAFFLLVVAAGSFAAEGGFSGKGTGSAGSTTAKPSGSPSIAGSGGSSGSSASSAAPQVAAGGSHNLVGIPPAPTITSEPSDPTTSTTATFKYSDAVILTSFRCSLDSSAYSQCGTVINLPSVGAITYNNVLPGSHCFSVEGVTALLLVSTPTTYCWQQNGVGFSISWSAPAKYYPGLSQSANLVIGNPNGKAITIAAKGITVTGISTTSSACSPSNFGMTRDLAASVTIPANTTESLSAAGLGSSDWPVITMFDGDQGAGSHTNQDGCVDVGLTFTFSGSASGT